MKYRIVISVLVVAVLGAIYSIYSKGDGQKSTSSSENPGSFELPK